MWYNLPNKAKLMHNLMLLDMWVAEGSQRSYSLETKQTNFGKQMSWKATLRLHCRRHIYPEIQFADEELEASIAASGSAAVFAPLWAYSLEKETISGNFGNSSPFLGSTAFMGSKGFRWEEGKADRMIMATDLVAHKPYHEMKSINALAIIPYRPPESILYSDAHAEQSS